MAATTALLRCHFAQRAPRPSRLGRRAMIARPNVKDRKFSARACASAYRRAGSLAGHLRMMVSRSRGRSACCIEHGPDLHMPQHLINGHKGVLEAGTDGARRVLCAGGGLGMGGD
jgi:hypothetical protein